MLDYLQTLVKAAQHLCSFPSKRFAKCTAPVLASSTTAFSWAAAVEVDTHFCNLEAQMIALSVKGIQETNLVIK